MLIPILLLETGAYPNPTPGPPQPYFPTSGGGGGGGSGIYRGSWRDLIFIDEVVDEVCEEVDTECGPDPQPPSEVRSEPEIPSEPHIPLGGADAIPSVPSFVIDLLGPGALSFGATKKLTRFASGKYGPRGEAVAAVGSTLAAVLTTRKAGTLRLPIVAGASIASLETLYQIFVAAQKKPVRRAAVAELEARLARERAAVHVGSRQVMMTGRSGRLYRVLVIQYSAELAGVVWFAQEARRFDGEGAVDISGTLLERLAPAPR